jgi:hypothetical protein
MNHLSWFKFYPGTIMHDPRFTRLTIPERYYYIVLHTLAFSHPAPEHPGQIALSDDDIAHVLELEVGDWQSFKSKLMTRGLIAVAPNIDRQVIIPNWETYQAPKKLAGKEAESGKKKKDNPAAVAARMRRYRAKPKGAVTGTVTGVTGTVTGVTGEVTGAVTGEVTGTVTGVTGEVTGAGKRRNRSSEVLLSDQGGDTVTGTVTGVTGEVTGAVTGAVTGSHRSSSDPYGAGVSGDAVTGVYKRREEKIRKDQITHKDPDRAREEETGIIPTSREDSIDQARKLANPYLAMEQRLRGERELPRYRTSWRPNGIVPEFLAHVVSYLESLPMAKGKIVEATEAMSWIVRREYDDRGRSEIEVQVIAWDTRISGENRLSDVVTGSANKSLAKRYESLQRAVNAGNQIALENSPSFPVLTQAEQFNTAQDLGLDYPTYEEIHPHD